METIYLDPRITSWVLFPILIVMICVGVIRFYVLAMMQAQPLEQNSKEHTENSYVKFSESLAQNGAVLGTYYANTAGKTAAILESGDVLARPEFSGLVGLFNPLALDRAVAQFRMQAFTYLPQTVIVKWIGVYFAGIIVLKLPFPLTPQFKDMLQTGLGTHDLDVRWVTSASWYVILFLGVESILALILPPSLPQPRVPVTMDLFKTLSDRLSAKQKDDLQGIEERVLKLETRV